MNTLVDPLKIQEIREQFPILSTQMSGKPLVYLDNGATTQKPQRVIDAVKAFYDSQNSNIHRGIYELSEQATVLYEKVRARVAGFINANPQEIVFTSGTTASINLVASALTDRINKGDEILLTLLEHHSNIVPWQQLAKRTGAVLKFVGLTEDGSLDLDDLTSKLSASTKIVAVTHISNVLGTVVDVKQIAQLAHDYGALVLVDGAQAIAHQAVDVSDLECDFYVFSGHKMYGPTGVGVLYGKKSLLDTLEPPQTGGGMITEVHQDKSAFAETPFKFEAGTPPIAQVIGLGEAISFIKEIGWESIIAHEHSLSQYCQQELDKLKGITVLGPETKAPVFSLVDDGIHPHDIAHTLNTCGVAVRAGHHCAMPLMTHLNLSATTRASFAIYNTKEDIDALIAGLQKVQEVFS